MSSYSPLAREEAEYGNGPSEEERYREYQSREAMQDYLGVARPGADPQRSQQLGEAAAERNSRAASRDARAESFPQEVQDSYAASSGNKWRPIRRRSTGNRAWTTKPKPPAHIADMPPGAPQHREAPATASEPGFFSKIGRGISSAFGAIKNFFSGLFGGKKTQETPAVVRPQVQPRQPRTLDPDERIRGELPRALHTGALRAHSAKLDGISAVGRHHDVMAEAAARAHSRNQDPDTAAAVAAQIAPHDQRQAGRAAELYAPDAVRDRFIAQKRDQAQSYALATTRPQPEIFDGMQFPVRPQEREIDQKLGVTDQIRSMPAPDQDRRAAAAAATDANVDQRRAGSQQLADRAQEMTSQDIASESIDGPISTAQYEKAAMFQMEASIDGAERRRLANASKTARGQRPPSKSYAQQRAEDRRAEGQAQEVAQSMGIRREHMQHPEDFDEALAVSARRDETKRQMATLQPALVEDILLKHRNGESFDPNHYLALGIDPQAVIADPDTYLARYPNPNRQQPSPGSPSDSGMEHSDRDGSPTSGSSGAGGSPATVSRSLSAPEPEQPANIEDPEDVAARKQAALMRRKGLAMLDPNALQGVSDSTIGGVPISEFMRDREMAASHTKATFEQDSHLRFDRKMNELRMKHASGQQLSETEQGILAGYKQPGGFDSGESVREGAIASFTDSHGVGNEANRLLAGFAYGRTGGDSTAPLSPTAMLNLPEPSSPHISEAEKKAQRDAAKKAELEAENQRVIAEERAKANPANDHLLDPAERQRLAQRRAADAQAQQKWEGAKKAHESRGFFSKLFNSGPKHPGPKPRSSFDLSSDA